MPIRADPFVPYDPGRIIDSNGIELFVDAFGEPEAPTILLVAGLGGQAITWDDPFCQLLAIRGYRVVRFDLRDTGLSTKFDQAGEPDLPALIRAALDGQPLPGPVPYTLEDMANDTVGLLDALDIQTAHVVGLSMGGMIGQLLAIHYPDRVQTLTSLMSSTTAPDLPLPRAEAISLFLRPPAPDRERYIERALEGWRVLRGTAFPFDEAWARARAGRLYDRGIYPAGSARHIAAILASGSRREALRSVRAPTLVIHGDADPLLPVEGGIDTARVVPNAHLWIIPALGHELPPAIWPQVVGAITGHAGRSAS